MSGYFTGQPARFSLYESPTLPRWRSPQRGALGALLSHWSLPHHAPALLSLPTGTGKTAVALAAPYLVRPTRILVVVPSTELRRHMVAMFSFGEVLRRIGALEDDGTNPIVRELTGRVTDWDQLADADVVVALPNTISPVHYPDAPPPADLFDLIIIDEAHHAPAPTWSAVLDHFSSARALLLTATPRRLDGRKVPGDHIFHYPLRQALDERIFKPVVPHVLEMPVGATKEILDQVIREHALDILNDPVHATSTLMVRAASVQRAGSLAATYAAAGMHCEVLHSGLGSTRQRKIVNDLRSGELRAVAVVGMLIEGFDLPSLRVVAYHDKHKSLPATAQLIGRLARVDDAFPQPSNLVTIRDLDVYPELHGVVRELYAEDSDWASVLPGIIDDEIRADLANRDYVRHFAQAPPELSLDALAPLRRGVIWEVPEATPPDGILFPAAAIPEQLSEGRMLRGRRILYSGLNEAADTLVVVTQAVERPRWHNAPGLDAVTHELHVVSWRRAPRTTRRDLLVINSGDASISRDLLDAFDADGHRAPADPTRIQDAFDSFDRISVSSVGVRNTYASNRGTPTYRMYAGKGVDRGLREVDTAHGSLGHAMIQVAGDSGAFTAGVATAKGKFWETRYAPLRGYDAFVTELAERYWFPTPAPVGPLLPQVSRGRRLEQWPDAIPLAVEPDDALVGTGWSTESGISMDALDLRASAAVPTTTGRRERLPLQAVALQPTGEAVVWTGEQDLLGTVHATGPDLMMRRGFGFPRPLSEVLSERPPTIFFADGTTVHGTIIVDSRIRTRAMPSVTFVEHDWSGANPAAETRATAERLAAGISVHEALEQHLSAQPRAGHHRWIVCNDGSGELADYLVIEADRNWVQLHLWHAKAAGGPPAARVTDLQELLAQAIKSRRWITDPGIWAELGRRLTGQGPPPARLVEGRLVQLLVLCGQHDRAQHLAFTRTRPMVTGSVNVVQPGLSLQAFRERLAADDQFAVQCRDLLAVFHDSVSQVAATSMLCSP